MAVDSATVVGAHESRSFSGSRVMPFLNSRRDRSSGREEEEERVKRVRKRRDSNNNLGGEFIGVNVVGNRNTDTDRDRDTLIIIIIIHLKREREREKRGTLGA